MEICIAVVLVVSGFLVGYFWLRRVFSDDMARASQEAREQDMNSEIGLKGGMV